MSKFKHLEESIRQMLDSINGGSPPAVERIYDGKVLLEIRRNGEKQWTLSMGAETIRDTLEVHQPASWDEFIKLIRKTLLQTQAGFAELIGIPQRTLQEWEQGRAVPGRAARLLLLTASKAPEKVYEAASEDPCFA